MLSLYCFFGDPMDEDHSCKVGIFFGPSGLGGFLGRMLRRTAPSFILYKKN